MVQVLLRLTLLHKALFFFLLDKTQLQGKNQGENFVLYYNPKLSKKFRDDPKQTSVKT